METSPPGGGGTQNLTVHQLLGQFAPAYRERYPSMPLRHRQVLQKILLCRTSVLGGQLLGCPDCHRFHYRYHSCNDRHCPQCGHADTEDWLQRQQERLLFPVPYFLVTFTVPEALRLFIRSHLKIGLDLLFAASAQALQDLAAHPKRLGAQLGMLGVLHTWTRTLIFHPHIHYLIPGGGLSLDGRTWVPAKNNFLLPHQPLGEHFRTLFKARLLKEHPDLFPQVPEKVWEESWNVGCQAAGSGLNALRYLSRYLFKTATANRPLQLLPEGKILWTYRQSKTRKFTALKLEPLEFMSRFLQHILPPGYARVRTFGWLHPAAKVRANRVRALLNQAPRLTPQEQHTWKSSSPAPPQPPGPTPAPEPVHHPPPCPCCRQPMRLIAVWSAGHRPPVPPRNRSP